MNIDNIKTIVVNMPNSVKAYSIYKDGYYTIVLNDKLDYNQKMMAYMHEIMHIRNNDFDSNKSIDLIEEYTHKGEKVWQRKKEYQA